MQCDTEASDSGCGIGFTEALWGDTTRGLVDAAQQLMDTYWEELIEGCKPYLPHHASAQEDIQRNGDHPNRGHQRSALHASIQVDW